MIVSTKKSETLSSLKSCKRCGSAPIVSRKYDLFNAPGDLKTVIQCPICGKTVEGLTDDYAASQWNNAQEEKRYGNSF